MITLVISGIFFGYELTGTSLDLITWVGYMEAVVEMVMAWVLVTDAVKEGVEKCW